MEMLDKQIEELQKMIDSSQNIVFFGGAGVSTESGIPDFRGADGIYHQETKHKVSPEEILSHTFYIKYPEAFYDFYRENLLFPDALPNAAHVKLAELEAAGKCKAVVTQNIDGLHQAAGSKIVYELHGSVLRNFCTSCHKFYNMDVIMQSKKAPVCECGGAIKPDVVLYEEGLNSFIMNGALQAISQADMLIIGGTSLAVYPAAGLIDYYDGNKLVLINKTPTSQDRRANLVLHGSIGEIFSKIRV